ncbi:hypothetical protein L557_1285 [Bordetella pertussis STO1-CNMC-0004]|nr:hypothetical protein L557_1285 [Bordetella pertussis STO1-CNMC-0004]
MYAWFIRTGFEKLEIHRARCTHLQTQPGRIQPIDSSQLAGRNRGRGNTGQTRTLRRPLDKRSEIAI